MPPGKLATQAGHAYTNTLLQADYETVIEYQGEDNIGTKALLFVNSQKELEELYCEAQYLGLNCNLVIDKGHVLPPHFDGSEVITALGVGPINRKDAHFIKDLKTK